ncbi:MAG TPA: nucleoside hydrolase [Candidatus Brocadiia bacterium]|nr:nucleoside hydrolase [Candidatus Brocadiia bacterium]
MTSLFIAVTLSTITAATPVNVIFDTDIASDVDDVGALATLHALADRGEANILATVVSAEHEWCAPCLNALNGYFGRPGIPVGRVRLDERRRKALGHPSRYAKGVAESLPRSLTTSEDAEDATALYRRILSKQPDKSVVIVTVGFLTNMADLLDSKPDDKSDLNGADLVRRKVSHWVCMGGGAGDIREFNLLSDAPSSVRAVRDWPSPITFSGAEIGVKIMTGAGLSVFPERNPVRMAYTLFHEGTLRNRESWDQTAVLYAVWGLKGDLSSVWNIGRGRTTVHEDGSNTWEPDPKGPHAYLIEKMPPKDVAGIIESLMMEACRKASGR